MNKLVELDAVINEIEEWYEMYPDSDTARKALMMLKRSVKKIPAADAQPAAHGEWERFCSGIDWQCSNCNWSTRVDIPRNFCPNCGADMRFRW